MALTLPYPTLSGAFTISGPAQVDIFGTTTVHNDTNHNNPHAKLLANDVAIAAFLNGANIQVDSFTIPAGTAGQINGTPEVILASSSITFNNKPTLFFGQWTYYADTVGQYKYYIKLGATTLNAFRTPVNNTAIPTLMAYVAAPGSGSIVVAAAGSAWAAGQQAHVYTDISNNVITSLSDPRVYVVQFLK